MYVIQGCKWLQDRFQSRVWLESQLFFCRCGFNPPPLRCLPLSHSLTLAHEPRVAQHALRRDAELLGERVKVLVLGQQHRKGERRVGERAAQLERFDDAQGALAARLRLDRRQKRGVRVCRGRGGGGRGCVDFGQGCQKGLSFQWSSSNLGDRPGLRWCACCASPAPCSASTRRCCSRNFCAASVSQTPRSTPIKTLLICLPMQQISSTTRAALP